MLEDVRDMMGSLSSQIVVVLSTHNGSDILAETLEGYSHVKAPTCPWRLIVVDNASTDDTPEVLKRYEARLPLIVLQEPTPGKNKALNRALRYVSLEADLYVFTDDDAVPDPAFLQEWEKVMRAYPDADLFGATIRPLFKIERPAWLKAFAPWHAELYAENSREDGPMEASWIFGPNMAVRRAIFSAGKGFNESIGPNSSAAAYPMGSETEFCTRVVKETGAQAWFVSGPKVSHIVRPNQMTQDFIRKRAYRHGRGFAMRDALTDTAPIAADLKFAVKQAVRAVGAKLGHPKALWNYHWNQGYISYRHG